MSRRDADEAADQPAVEQDTKTVAVEAGVGPFVCAIEFEDQPRIRFKSAGVGKESLVAELSKRLGVAHITLQYWDGELGGFFEMDDWEHFVGQTQKKILITRDNAAVKDEVKSPNGSGVAPVPFNSLDQQLEHAKLSKVDTKTETPSTGGGGGSEDAADVKHATDVTRRTFQGNKQATSVLDVVAMLGKGNNSCSKSSNGKSASTIRVGYKINAIGQVDTALSTFYCDSKLFAWWTDTGLIDWPKKAPVNWKGRYDPDLTVTNDHRLRETYCALKLASPASGQVKMSKYFRGLLFVHMDLHFFPFDFQVKVNCLATTLIPHPIPNTGPEHLYPLAQVPHV